MVNSIFVYRAEEEKLSNFRAPVCQTVETTEVSSTFLSIVFSTTSFLSDNGETSITRPIPSVSREKFPRLFWALDVSRSCARVLNSSWLRATSSKVPRVESNHKNLFVMWLSNRLGIIFFLLYFASSEGGHLARYRTSYLRF